MDGYNRASTFRGGGLYDTSHPLSLPSLLRIGVTIAVVVILCKMGRTIPSFRIALAMEKGNWKHNNTKKLK
jgi:hypothetical protein